MEPVHASEQAPNLSLGSSQTVGRVTRTGLQVSAGAFVVQGIELFVYDFTEDQATWAGIALTILVAFIQNVVEERRGRKFIGTAPTPAVAPPA